MSDFAPRLAAHMGSVPVSDRLLSHGVNGRVHLVGLADGRQLVVKDGGQALDIEGRMLEYLARHSALPVPALHLAEPDLLAMDFVPAGGRLDAASQADAARRLAALHAITAPRFGFEADTLIGPLPQPNGWMENWPDFFGQRRLLHMAGVAAASGAIDDGLHGQIRRLAGRLPGLIGDHGPPALLHGDLWAGNVLVDDGRVAAFIDPAIYFGDAEMDLAFATLFGGFGRPFFDAYQALRPIRPGFFETRLHLYNLWPLLIHAHLFGGHYAGQVAAILARLDQSR